MQASKILIFQTEIMKRWEFSAGGQPELRNEILSQKQSKVCGGACMGSLPLVDGGRMIRAFKVTLGYRARWKAA